MFLSPLLEAKVKEGIIMHSGLVRVVRSKESR